MGKDHIITEDVIKIESPKDPLIVFDNQGTKPVIRRPAVLSYSEKISVSIGGNTFTNQTSGNKSNISSNSMDVMFVGESTNSLIKPFSNNIVTSKSDNDLRESLQYTIGNLKDFSIVQNSDLIDYVDVSKPLVLDSDNIIITFNDIYGTEFSYNIYQDLNNTYFALAAYTNRVEINNYGVITANDNKYVTEDLKSSYSLFRLYQDLQPSSYFVYIFNDIPNNQITYNKYLGQVNFVNGIPMGTQVPKYENLVKTSTLDPDTLNYESYISSAKIDFRFNNGSILTDDSPSNAYSGNVVLTEISIPELDLEKTEDGNYILTENCVLDPDYKIITTDDKGVKFNELKNNKTYNNFVENLTHLIKAYTLYSPANIIKPYSEYINTGTKRQLVSKIKVNPVTLFIPTLIYTDVENNTYKYVPYEDVSDLSDEKIELSVELNNTKDDPKSFATAGIVTVKVFKDYTNDTPQIIKRFRWNKSDDIIRVLTDNIAAENRFDYIPENTNYESAKIVTIENREWIYVGSIDNKYSIYIKINNIGQDENLNFTELDLNNSLNIDDVESNIVHIIVFTEGDVFIQKVNLKYSNSVSVPLYNFKSVKINNVSYTMLPDMTYVNYLERMTTTYNLKHVTGIDYNYGWKFDPNVSSIKYCTDVLFEREALNVTYSYWSPKDNSYLIYDDKILEYNGKFYGSNVFKERNTDATDKITDYRLIQVFKRTKLAGESNNPKDELKNLSLKNVEQSASFIKGNEEIKYQTYSNIPFELKNESSLEFTGKYSFVEPEIGYIINATETDSATEYFNQERIIWVSNKVEVQKLSNEGDYYIGAKYSITNSSYAINDNFSLATNTNTYLTYDKAGVLLESIDFNELTRMIGSSNPNSILSGKNETNTYNDVFTKDSNFITNNSLYTNKYWIEYYWGVDNKQDNKQYAYTSVIDIIKFQENENNVSKIENPVHITFNDGENNYDLTLRLTSNNKIYDYDATLNTHVKEVLGLLSINENNKNTVLGKITENITEESNIKKHESGSTYYTHSSKDGVSYFNNITYYDAKKLPIPIFGFTYSVSSIITTDGYWKPEYKEVVKPFINVSYSFASNSVDISNAYIVPTTRNERLGFVHNPRVTYNAFVSSYVKEYKYTYCDELTNIQKNFFEDNEHKIFQVGDKYFGLDSSSSTSLNAFEYKSDVDNTGICNRTFDSDEFVLQIFAKPEENVFSYEGENTGKEKFFAHISSDIINKLSDEQTTDNKYYLYNPDILQNYISYIKNQNNTENNVEIGTLINTENALTITKSIISRNGSLLYVTEEALETAYTNNRKYVYPIIKNIWNVALLSHASNREKLIEDLLRVWLWKNDKNTSSKFSDYNEYKTRYKINDIISENDINFYAINKATSEPDNVQNKYNIYCKYNIDDKNVVKLYYLGDINSINIKISSTKLVELHRRLIVSQERHLEEIVLQEEEYVPQNAQIDTPFGIVNGKKVIVTDEVYVPETYADIISVDPVTYEYFTDRVVLTEAYYSYTYEVENIPLITAAYIYNDEDGIKIQGMDTLVEVLSGLRTGVDNKGNSYIIPASLPTTSLNKESFEKINKSFNAYMTKLTDSLVYINAAIDRTNNQIGNVAYAIGTNEDNEVSLFRTLSNTLLDTSKNKIEANKTNTSNSINAQKSMFNKLTQSIDNQTTTLSKMMLVNMLGKGSAYTADGVNAITGLLNSMSGVVPQNWQSVEKTGYEYTYEVLVNSYKALSYKHTKVIGKDLKHASYVTRTGSYIYESPSYVTLTYSIYADKTLSSNERIGLHLKKETRNFTYNGYIYKEHYYSYENIADILADLHISNRLPTRKEFIVDVSKRLYINSDFIFSYTSPNEYAIRAIRRADILWGELVKANVVQDSKETQRPLPEIPQKRKVWWKDDLILRRFATILDLDINKLITLNDSEFVKIDSIIKSRLGLTLIPTNTSYILTKYLQPETDSSKDINISEYTTPTLSSKITTVNRIEHLADIFEITYDSLKQNPEVITELKEITSPYKANYSLEDVERLNNLE